MFVFFYIGLSLILAILFILSYISVEKIRGSKWFFSWRIYQYLKNILEGSIYGLLMIIFKMIAMAIEPSIVVPIFIIGVLLLVLVRNVVVGIFAIFPPLIYYLVNYEIAINLYVTLGLMIVMLFVIQFVHFFVKDFLANLSLINLWMTLAFFSLLAYDFIVNKQITRQSVEIIFVPYFNLMIIYSLLEVAIKFLVSANILYKSVNFNFSRYYRQSLREVAIGDFISSQKLQRGLYGILEFNYQKPHSIERNLEIKESILLDLESVFPEKAVLFRADEERYGYFLPLDLPLNLKNSIAGNDIDNRGAHDILHKVEQLVKSRSITYVTSWKEKLFVEIRSGVAIYGIQDYSIFNLHNYADFALRNEQSSQKNCVQLFKPFDYFFNLREKRALNEMDASIKLDNFINYFTPIFDYKNRQTVMNIITTEKIEYSEIKESVRDFVNFFSWTNLFDRYMAFWALSNLPRHFPKLAFFYSPQIFEQVFDFELFELKLQKLHLTADKLIFIFDPYMFAKIKEKTTFFNNLQKLKMMHVQIAVIDTHLYHQNDLKILNPHYFLLDDDKSFAKFQDYVTKHELTNVINKKQLIWFNLKSQQDFNFAITKQGQLLGGEILQKNQFISKLDKKSKMYIYELLKSRER